MKKRTGVALLLFACLAPVRAEMPDAGWQESFERAFASSLESRQVEVAPAILARYRLLVDKRFSAAGDPSVAGEAAALLMLRYEKDIRTGVDTQEAGARLVQAVRMMGRSADPEKVLRKLDMVRKAVRTGRNPGFSSGFVGQAGSNSGDSGGDMRGREKGK